ncbi:lipoprotein, partial [human gut metagenome]
MECRIARVYYTDKFGQTQQTTDAGSIAGMGITATPDPGLNGNIDIYSPLPTNNTIRYIDLEVTNEDGVTRTVTIAQYPLEYITNILGWYSYRDDFGGTTYENQGANRYVSASIDTNWWTGQWSWDYSSSRDNGFFRSKVATSTETTGSYAGKS